MDTPPLAIQARIRFPGLASSAIEHPADRAALEALRRTPGLEKLLKALSDIGLERFARIRFTADSIRVSPKQCARLYDDLKEACAILDVVEPAMYLVQDPTPNAFAFGMLRFNLVMTTGLVDLLDDTERLAVIGHELGHIKAEHMLYRTMAIILAVFLSEVSGGLAGIGSLLTQALGYALFE
ncbi:MAG TPA: M48 family metallopeptidase, partial [Chthonomonadales bacterium]|nr:M48 family metallopeptidase [Chthonomonadales bacterium]